MTIYITVKSKDYREWDGNYIHKSIRSIKHLDSIGIDKIEDAKLIPLFISKRESQGKKNNHWGFCGSDGEEYNVTFDYLD
eukprot:SAG11_NODE_465_length_9217_cov_93.852161_6_plen_80_part_00